ncbi:MAG TPA: ROK family protein [Bacilli bacterium]|nr:MAG: Glucokinase [Tenericutes bacterium ADurb.BinA124]HPX84867.1 ROK family protein [Bacilli bacterium]HQC75061.1 ROK family protein [Bacilli bacterium]
MQVVFGVDIGGTTIKIGKFNNNHLLMKKTIKTDISKAGTNILPDIYQSIEAMLGDDQLQGIGLGVPGPCVDGVVLGAQNLNWQRVEAKKILLEHYPGIKVAVLNDANAATLGEMAAGGAQNFSNFVFLTIGTGIGGGIVINNQLVEGFTGSTGEIGHLRVAFENERQCTCGLFDCLEQYASATGLVKTVSLLINKEPSLIKGKEISAENIFYYAKKQDAVCLQAVEVMVEKLATALAAIANTVNPEAFVIGGGVSQAGDFLISKLNKRFQELAFFSVRSTEFHLATLGNDAGIFGTSYAASR